jgi:hydrogenase expression/formation protein HypC
MCLGVPGKVISIEPNPMGMTMGRVNFSGITKEVCLAYVPEVQVGDYVVVHVGFAISTVDEEEAQEVFRFLEQMDELGELAIPQPE